MHFTLIADNRRNRLHQNARRDLFCAVRARLVRNTAFDFHDPPDCVIFSPGRFVCRFVLQRDASPAFLHVQPKSIWS